MKNLTYSLMAFILLVSNSILCQSTILINEIMSENVSVLTDEYGEHSDWIELYNSGATAINLSGYGISDNLDEPFKWTFPSVVIAPEEYLVIFASGKDYTEGTNLHTNFKLSKYGEPLTLTKPDGAQIDYIPPTPLAEDVSFGRLEDGGDMMERLFQSSPELSNSISEGIIFSHESGFYPTAIDLEMASTNGDAIRFTTDGSNPSGTSPLYSSPENLASLDLVPDVISNINTSPSWSAPEEDNFKAHVIKAATYSGGELTSNVYTKVIFIHPDLNERYETFDIISIVTDPGNLFDHDTGIYVKGVHYSPGDPTWSGNYFQKGELWERKANLQYFNTAGELQFNQEIGIRTHGGKGRNLPQKSLRIYTHGEEGAPKINYPFFEHLGEEKQVFDKLILRNSLTCWNNSIIKDEVTAQICRDLNFEIQNSKPVIVFMNGEYWGLQSIREYFDDKYINEKYGVHKDSVNIVLHGSGNRTGVPIEWGTVEGTNEGHIAFYTFLNENDITIAENYEYIESVLDIPSIIDYYCTEIYFNNKDWPTNNNKLWNNGSLGKWRQMFYDIDGGWQYLGVSYNQLNRALSATGSGQNAPYATFLFRKLVESPIFLDQFLHRMACLMKTTFDAENVVEIINLMKGFCIDGVEEHIDRWHRPTSYAAWSSGVNGLISFANGRRDHVIAHIENQFDIEFDIYEYDCTEEPDYSTAQENEKYDFNIYPNPTTDKRIWVNFDFADSPIDYQIHNITGRLMDSGKIGNHEQLLLDYASGTYLLTLLFNETVITKRVILR